MSDTRFEHGVVVYYGDPCLTDVVHVKIPSVPSTLKYYKDYVTEKMLSALKEDLDLDLASAQSDFTLANCEVYTDARDESGQLLTDDSMVAPGTFLVFFLMPKAKDPDKATESPLLRSYQAQKAHVAEFKAKVHEVELLREIDAESKGASTSQSSKAAKKKQGKGKAKQALPIPASPSEGSTLEEPSTAATLQDVMAALQAVREESAEVKEELAAVKEELAAVKEESAEVKETLGAKIVVLEKDRDKERARADELQQRVYELHDAAIDSKNLDKIRIRDILDDGRLSIMKLFPDKPRPTRGDWYDFASQRPIAVLWLDTVFRNSKWNVITRDQLQWMYEVHPFRRDGNAAAHGFPRDQQVNAVAKLPSPGDRATLSLFLTLI